MKCRLFISKHFEQHEHDHDQKNESNAATRIRSPIAAVGPRGNYAKQQKSQNYQYDGHIHSLIELVGQAPSVSHSPSCCIAMTWIESKLARMILVETVLLKERDSAAL